MRTMKEPLKIESQKAFDSLLKKRNHEYPLGCFIVLRGGLRSSKDICLNYDGDYWVYNDIDDTEEVIKHDKLMSTFIGEAISKGAFYRY